MRLLRVALLGTAGLFGVLLAVFGACFVFVLLKPYIYMFIDAILPGKLGFLLIIGPIAIYFLGDAIEYSLSKRGTK